MTDFPLSLPAQLVVTGGTRAPAPRVRQNFNQSRTGQVVTSDYGLPEWYGSFEFAPIIAGDVEGRKAKAAWDVFIAQLNGRAGTFIAPDVFYDRMGDVQDDDVISLHEAAQADATHITLAFHNVHGVDITRRLAAGDRFTIGGTDFHMVIGVDDKSVQITPPLRRDFSSATVIEHARPFVVTRLGGESTAQDIEAGQKIIRFSLDWIEAL